MKNPIRLIPILVLLALLGSACTLTLTPKPPSMANPASVHCEEEGGVLDIRTNTDGGQAGYCQFDDGSECEEWTFFRGDCQPGEFQASPEVANPAAVYCIDQGGTSEIRQDDDGSQYGVCIFEDESECDEWAFFRGDCQPGDFE